ncbi:hypothetical protein [Niallia sp. 01092]|uniref:hypothetical protein n=1 Tax=unclassified Niallia TaxID=2837522 RepID=UPI003FD49B8E
MNLKDTLTEVITNEAELQEMLNVYEQEGYIPTTSEEMQQKLLDLLEGNDFYVYDTQFIDGVHRLYIEL